VDYLEVRNLGCVLDGVAILEDVSFHVRPGERLAVLGPNGAGKTTLLRHLAGVRRPPRGAVLLEGRDQRDHTPREWALRVSYVPQGHDFEAPFTAGDLVLQGRYPHLGPFDTGGRGDREIAERALESVGMAAFAARRFSSLSGGEQQKVMIASALAQESDIIALDEPTSFLDLRHQVELVRLLDRLPDERGVTLVFVTHDVNLAARLGSRVLALKKGRRLFDGPPSRVLNREGLEALFETRFRFLRPAPGDEEDGAGLVVQPRWGSPRKDEP
jgi:iron complex transport system ATP-binding protein